MNGKVFVYARSDSTRLPGKPFLKLGPQLVIDVVMRRASSFGLGKALLLTTWRSQDDALARHVEASGYRVIRGHPTDLVDRTVSAIHTTSADYFFRVNGDSPLVDYTLAYEANRIGKNFDVVSNIFSRTYPYGVAVERVSSTFYIRNRGNCQPREAEHVTSHLYRGPRTMKAVSIVSERDDSHISLALDTQHDYERLQPFFSNQQSTDISHVNYWDVLNMTQPKSTFVVLGKD